MKSFTTGLLCACLILSTTVLAQQPREDVYADPENLKILPKDISSAALADTMKSFAMGLGVRCETCHVGEPNTPLTSFDFASDEKPMKQKARLMIKMVAAINEKHVPKLDKIEKADRVEVRCVTCHRGRPQPKLIEDLLDEALAEDGLEATTQRYASLREEFYGSHSYDFTEFSLPMYAQGLVGRDELQAAIALTKVNTGHFPESYYTFFVLAELYRRAGDDSQAVDNYARAIELNPRAKPFLQAKIDEINAGN